MDRLDLGFWRPGTAARLRLSTRVMAHVFQPLEVPALAELSAWILSDRPEPPWSLW